MAGTTSIPVGSNEAISQVLGMPKIGGVCGMIGDPGAGIEALFVVSELPGGSKAIVDINGGAHVPADADRGAWT